MIVIRWEKIFRQWEPVAGSNNEEGVVVMVLRLDGPQIYPTRMKYFMEGYA